MKARQPELLEVQSCKGEVTEGKGEMEGGENQSIRLCASVTGGRLPGVKLSQRALRDPLQHLFGENPHELPADVQSFKHTPVLIGTWTHTHAHTHER